MFFEARHTLDVAYAGELAKLSGFGIGGGDEDGVCDDVHRAEDGNFAGGEGGLDSGLRGCGLGAGGAAAGLGDLGARGDGFGG